MTGNNFVKFFLRTPLHIFMGDTMLITVTGCKSGKKYTTPVGFYRDGDFLWILSSRDRTWWRNVKGGAQVEMRILGKKVSGYAEVVLDKDEVAKKIMVYARRSPLAGKGLGIRMENGEPHPEDAARLAKERMFVKIKQIQP